MLGPGSRWEHELGTSPYGFCPRCSEFQQGGKGVVT